MVSPEHGHCEIRRRRHGMSHSHRCPWWLKLEMAATGEWASGQVNKPHSHAGFCFAMCYGISGLLMVVVRRLVHSAARLLVGSRRHHAPGIARCRDLVVNDALPHAIHTCRSWKSLDTPGRVKARRQRSASEAVAETFHLPARLGKRQRTIPQHARMGPPVGTQRSIRGARPDRRPRVAVARARAACWPQLLDGDPSLVRMPIRQPRQCSTGPRFNQHD